MARWCIFLAIKFLKMSCTLINEGVCVFLLSSPASQNPYLIPSLTKLQGNNRANKASGSPDHYYLLISPRPRIKEALQRGSRLEISVLLSASTEKKPLFPTISVDFLKTGNPKRPSKDLEAD